MTPTLWKASFRCRLTDKIFDVWFGSAQDAQDAQDRLQATLIEVQPSSQTEYDLAFVLTALGARKQLRD